MSDNELLLEINRSLGELNGKFEQHMREDAELHVTIKDMNRAITDIGEKLEGKADHEDVEKVEDRVNGLDSKVNLITGAWAGIIALLTLGGTFLALFV